MWMKVASLAKNDVQRRLSLAFHAASSCFRMSWMDCSSEVITAPKLRLLLRAAHTLSAGGERMACLSETCKATQISRISTASLDCPHRNERVHRAHVC